MGDDDDMKMFLASNTLPNVEFVQIKTDRVMDILNGLNRKGILTYSFYIAYKRWHKKVFEFCNNNINIDDYDIIHYLTPIGYREPGYLWKFNKPYVWGAVGGAPNIDIRLISRLKPSGQIKFYVRMLLNSLQLNFSLRLRRALNKTTILLTATQENKVLFQDIHNKNSIYIPENGTLGEYKGIEFSELVENRITNLIWIGRLDHGKNLSLLIDALTKIEDSSKVHVHVIGSGPLNSEMRESVNDMGLSSVFTFYGQIPRTEVANVIKDSDLHVVTSISEGNPTTIWEVMSYGVPTMTLSHCGMADTVRQDSGYHININSHEEMAIDIARKLDELIQNPKLLTVAKKNVCRDFYLNHWNKRVEFFNQVYLGAVEKFNSSRVSRYGQK
ncbi:glycosyltransferase [Vibrio breoganii]|uniref:glycosyltransferase n=1 Tax=Vibrio breoganii TaxID=553239 RepID=UPI0012FFE620|nr:glycosyltransferase [Vibrio breoganii]